VEFVRAARLQADKLIIGAILGADALGIYYFAVNAGLGIANSFSTALSTVLFPHLCASVDRDAAFVRSTVLFAALIAPVVIVQALAAPTYVPLVFGADWAEVAPLVGTLCLAAIPAVVWASASQYLRATGRVNTEFALSSLIAAAMIGAVALAAPFGLPVVAAAFVAVATLAQAGAALPFLTTAFAARRAAPALA
jgi:PST family polysaccharide transporter